ncbi:tRNA pseudouridine synthase, putative [Plasmodium ovale]|uniref:tRNA pseudouridine synthase n=1 Tax=Plasmodium ovale TaxID=36330 RepID=A0A1C3KQA6_PLAOA|nr:tRNA pseudouridine synthase, putative [Plasmodium ovale]
MEETHKFIIFFSYLGMEFNGSAYQKENTNTVENKLIENMRSLNLLPDENESFSRVSRTDKGVSARINALTIRLNVRHPHLPISEVQKIYAKELNKKLKNIRIAEVQSVPNIFDARLNCTHRTYVYFFMSKEYNMKRMEEATKLFLGEHDFSNFCKRRKSKTNYRRTILKFELRNIDKNFHYFKIKGTSFLYNQIRHMVATLFLVGKGQMDNIDIVNMLSGTCAKSKSYKIADENGLLLYSFKFSDLHFNVNVNNRIFSSVMNKYIQSTILLISLCYPLKIKEKNENLFENISDEQEILT